MTSSMNRLGKEDLLELCRAEKIRFLRLQFTDIDGCNKNVEVPERQFERAFDGKIMFDGSSIAGFVRIEESDMLLKPDLETFLIFPWEDHRGRVARVICDVANPDGTPFPGCPRSALKRVKNEILDMGYNPMLGPEAEFYLFQRNPDGTPTTITHDRGSYFDLAPIDQGEDCRRSIVNALEQMGFEVEAAHHECGAGQHEIDFKYDEAVSTADKIATFKFVVRKIAIDYNLHATFMPKPIQGIAGSGMHTHISLFEHGKNIFDDPKGADGLSQMALWFIGGLLEHARGMCAITNPTINSYKRLVPEFEAPTNIVWSLRNRSPLLRIPDQRGNGARVEVRNPDPSCNPYLAFTAMLSAGIDGIKNKRDPGPAVNKNIFAMSQREKRRLKIDELPADLGEAIDCLRKDDVIKNAIGNHLFESLIEAKSREWAEFRACVHQWELDRYLARH